MKAFYQFAATAVIALTSVAAYAAPIGYSKLEGSKFDVYYAASSAYTASLAGNTLQIAPHSLDVAVSWAGGGLNDLNSTLFIVAHDGVSLKSDVKQRFNGFYGLNPNSNFALESVKFSITSSLYASDYASDVFDYGSSFGAGYQTYRAWGSDYPYFDVVDSNAPWFQGDSSSHNDGSDYTQFALAFYATVYADSPSGLGSYARMDNIFFSFETIETAADVPEPTSLALLGIGALALMRRRSRK